ncbi:hypothetical protein NQ317_012423 [Molorchus minor]|uniref:Uncharacterized protein n=1 Tax=Molorchus minor TaxID=1323400 RepID=A0ABQ9JAX3_9CUCU|nr:hypothetical protein NQ317_012423 [Molorchus minor]
MMRWERESPVSYFIFREIFNKEFNLHFHPPITDSCKKCDLFNVQIKTVHGARKQQLEFEQELHQRKAQSARDGLRSDTALAKRGEASVICFDLMKTLPTPVLTAGIVYYKRQLWTYCFNIHDMGTDNSFMFVWDETVASREVGSCLLYYIKHFVTSKSLIMYSDQCGGQNRNIKLSVLCNYITASPDLTVEKIDHKFLVSGHSYLPCDQDFGLIEKEKNFILVFIPKEWHLVIKKARKKNPFKVIEMTKSDFISTKVLESNITNRKISETKTKVEWLKIQWLRFIKESPYSIQYKYSNREEIHFDVIDISKRKSTLNENQLPLLYPTGNIINEKKRKILSYWKLFHPYTTIFIQILGHQLKHLVEIYLGQPMKTRISYKNPQLASTLVDENFKDLKEFSDLDDGKLKLLMRKGVFFYDYLDKIERLDETELPDIEHFYNKLNDTNIDETDYAHAQLIWQTFNIQTLDEYSDLYRFGNFTRSDTIIIRQKRINSESKVV